MIFKVKTSEEEVLEWRNENRGISQGFYCIILAGRLYFKGAILACITVLEKV